jgi:hypothetical protein
LRDPNFRLNVDLDRFFVSTFRGWHRLEEQLDSGLKPVDIDVADPAIPPCIFQDRQEVVAHLDRLAEQIPATHVALIGNALAAATVLKCMIKTPVSLGQYVGNTVQLPIVNIPDDRLAATKANVIRALAEMDLGRQELTELPIDRDPAASIRRVLPILPQTLQALAVKLGIDSDALPFRVSTVASSEYWKSWISGNAVEGLLIRFNKTPRRPYYCGDVMVLALHEVCGHGLQMMQRRISVSTGEIANAYGITGIFGPEQFVFEGLAQTVPDWGTRLGAIKPNAELCFARFYEQLRVFVYHNAHCMLIGGACHKDVTEYVRCHLPAEPTTIVAREIGDRIDHPMLRAYLFVYGLGDCLFSEYTGNMNVAHLLECLQGWYRFPITAKQWLHLHGHGYEVR